MKTEIKSLGIFKVPAGATLDVTDPCYDRGVSCREKVTNCAGGDWEAIATIEDGEWGKRVAEVQVQLVGVTVDELAYSEQEIGSIGVDAGLAGVFVDKPDYNDKDWSNICDHLPIGNVMEVTSPDGLWKCSGAVVSSGYGDGYYSVCVSTNDYDQVIGIRIIFIYHEDENIRTYNLEDR